LGSFDARLFRDVNVFAERTAWAHGFVRIYALYAGLVLLACLVVALIWRARGGGFARGDEDRLPDALWTALAALLAFGIAIPLAALIGRSRPYAALNTQVEVLVHRSVSGGSLPSLFAAITGAVIVGAWLTRDRIVAVLATVVGLFLCFAQVYVGAQYPGDELAGLALGAIAVAALRPVALPAVAAARHGALSLGRGTRTRLEGRSEAPKAPEAGTVTPTPWVAKRVASPALHQPPAEASGTVRIVETGARVIPHDDPASRARVVGIAPATAHVHNVTRVRNGKASTDADTEVGPTQATGT
jgi:hypothetical protein